MRAPACSPSTSSCTIAIARCGSACARCRNPAHSKATCESHTVIPNQRSPGAPDPDPARSETTTGGDEPRPGRRRRGIRRGSAGRPGRGRDARLECVTEAASGRAGQRTRPGNRRDPPRCNGVTRKAPPRIEHDAVTTEGFFKTGVTRSPNSTPVRGEWRDRPAPPRRSAPWRAPQTSPNSPSTRPERPSAWAPPPPPPRPALNDRESPLHCSRGGSPPRSETRRRA